MSFTKEEIQYLHSQPLVRIATVAPDGRPDVAPVGFEFDESCFYIGGVDITRTRKLRNIRGGNGKVALVVDDLVSAEPWIPRFIRIYGVADLIEREGQFGNDSYIRVRPTISWSWNLDGKPVGHDEAKLMGPRRTIHA
ncbi:PPOX class F420-dependent oxidoreductase [soil metagenome]